MYVDPNVARKNAIQNKNLKSVVHFPDGTPPFSEIEFNITGLCNRLCSFCPRIDPKVYPNLNKHLTLELFTKITKDLAAVNYSGRLSLCGFSEPMLHKRILDIIKIARKNLPNCWLEIVTNGDQLKPEKIDAVFDAGLTALLISMYDGPEQIPFFEEMINKSKIDNDRVILRKRYLPPEEGYGIELSNRAGTVSINDGGVKIEALKEPLKHQCFYVHYRMMIDYNGDVILCPHDWASRLVAGNLNNDNVIDVWNNKILNTVRTNLGNANRNFAPCNQCDVLGTRQGEEHFRAWQNYNKTSKNLLITTL